MRNPVRIPNRDARNLWLASNGLAKAPVGAPDTISLICDLGFVQLDTIQVIARAHHHILWSRNQSYREPKLNHLLSKDRLVFEHFTHDASVLPMEYLPMWQRQFRRKKQEIEHSSWFEGIVDAKLLNSIKARIESEGALSTHAFDTKIQGAKEMWKRPPHKLALDYMWYSGELATCHREGFTKFYDLAERVFPDELREREMADQDQINWLCDAALDRIGFGTLGDVRKFWDATTVREINAWEERRKGDLVPVEIEAADGTWSKAFGSPDILERIATLNPPTARLRILNPFDPAIRDRTRMKRLFGFEYTVEMFVPAAKRKWGYYVYPMLEGNRLIGRIEAKGERSKGTLTVLNCWFESGVRATTKRAEKLDGELSRLARLADLTDVVWECSRL